MSHDASHIHLFLSQNDLNATVAFLCNSKQFPTALHTVVLSSSAKVSRSIPPCQKVHMSLPRQQSLDLNNGRVSQRDKILPHLELLFSKLSTKEMIERLDRAGVPFAPINRPSDLFEDPHLNAHQGLQEVTLPNGEREGTSVRLPSIPLEMSGERFELRRDIPRQGEHSHEILLELGLSEENITELLSRSRVASPS